MPTTKNNKSSKAKSSKPAAKGAITAPVLHKSRVESPVERVWEMADRLAKAGKSRKEILAAADKAGIAYWTVRTQYQAWKKAGEATPVKGSKAAK